MRIHDSSDLFDPDEDDRQHPGQLPAGAMWTGIDLVDSRAKGLQPSDLYLVAAAPGVGTTALLLTFARYLALTNDCRTLFASASESIERITRRLLDSASGVATPVGSDGALDRRQLERRRKSRIALAQAPMTIATSPTSRGDFLDLLGSGGFGAVIIDDLRAFNELPTLTPGGKAKGIAADGHPRHIVRDLKAAALQTDLAVIAGISVPSRGPEDPLELTDLADPGLVDAPDVVLTLRRDADELELIEACITKSRKGPTGVTDRLALLADRSVMANLARHQPRGDVA